MIFPWLLALYLLAGPVLAEDPEVSFSREIAPILAAKCITCHGPEKSKGGYQAHTFEFLRKSGKSKETPLAPGDPEASALYKRLTNPDPDERMPQKEDPLPATQIALFKKWIAQGARFDASDLKAPLASIIPRPPYPAPPASYPAEFPILSLAFDGNVRLLSGGYHELLVWEKNRLLQRITDIPERVQALAVAGDRIVLAGGSPGKSGEALLLGPGMNRISLLRSPDVALCAAISEKGGLIAIGGSDNSIELFDLQSGARKLRIEQHADWVMGLDFSPDGARLASASRDRTARVYDTARGELLATHADHEGPVYTVAFDAAGKQVLSAGRDKKIHIWNPADGKKTAEISGFEGEIFRLIVRDGFVFSAGGEGTVRKHTIADRKLAWAYEGQSDWVYALAVSPSGTQVASAGYQGRILLWDTATGALLQEWHGTPSEQGVRVRSGEEPEGVAR